MVDKFKKVISYSWFVPLLKSAGLAVLVALVYLVYLFVFGIPNTTDRLAELRSANALQYLL